MGDIKVHILFRFREGPWGGGNQFLKALRGYFQRESVYTADPEKADVILFNSFPFGHLDAFHEVMRLKKRKRVAVIHRVDGPVFEARGKDRAIDRIIFRFNQDVADGTIFQSGYSRERCIAEGLRTQGPDRVILNAPDSSIFFSGPYRPPGCPVSVVATSWSANPRKGFDVYYHLDEHYSGTSFRMTFVGACPVPFRNIEHLPPVEPCVLGPILREHDLFLSASMFEACSNSLLEALHCGLPAVARRNSSQPEIVGKGGETFNGKDDVVEAIQKVGANLVRYREGIRVKTLDEVGGEYLDFCREVHFGIREGRVRPKVYSPLSWACHAGGARVWTWRMRLGL